MELETYKMKKPVYFEVKGVCFNIDDSHDPRAESRTELTERAIKDLGRLVNQTANTDHKAISFHILTTCEGRADFCNNKKRGARIGYCYNSVNGNLYLAISGDMDEEIARQVIINNGYIIKEIKDIPGIIFPKIYFRGDSEEIKENAKREIAENIAERIAIEARHAQEDIYCR